MYFIGAVAKNIWNIFTGGDPQDIEMYRQPNSSRSRASPQTFVPAQSNLTAPPSSSTNWTLEALERIRGIAHYMRTSPSDIKHYAIFIRRIEPLQETFDTFGEILKESRPEDELGQWVTDWRNTINEILLKNVFRHMALQSVNLLNPQSNRLLSGQLRELEKSKEEYVKHTQDIRDLLDQAHRKVQEQLASPDYQRKPCLSVLQYLSNYWEALTLFAKIPEIPLPHTLPVNTQLPVILLNERKIDFDFAQFHPSILDHIDHQKLLNVGTPAVIYLKPGIDNKWKAESVMASDLPAGEAKDVRLRIDFIIQALRELKLVPLAPRIIESPSFEFSPPPSPSTPIY